jgi:hypothetical protein
MIKGYIDSNDGMFVLSMLKIKYVYFFWVSSIALCSLSFAFNLIFVGLVLSLYLQQGQHNPSHFINTSQDLQRLCPVP